MSQLLGVQDLKVTALISKKLNITGTFTGDKSKT